MRRWTLIAALLTAAIWSGPAAGRDQAGSAEGTMSITVGDGDLMVAGEGCTGGRSVTLHLEGRNIDAQPAGSFGAVAEQVVLVPEGDGSWSLTRVITDDRWRLQVTAECGIVGVDGFAYEPRSVDAPTFADLVIEGIDLTEPVAPGATLAFEVVGSCFSSRDVIVQVQDILFVVYDSAGPLDLGASGRAAAILTAPTEPGSYYLVARCGGWLGMPEVLTVGARQPSATTDPPPVLTGQPDQIAESDPVAPAATAIASSATYAG